MPVDTEPRKCFSPISDIRGTESLHYRKGEKIARCRLATLLRLLESFGWVEDAQFSASVKIGKSNEHFLLNPQSLGGGEVSAGSLVKCDVNGGTCEEDVDEETCGFHASLYSQNDKINCAFVLSSDKTIAASSFKCGLLPLCQEAMVLGKVIQQNYAGDLRDLQHQFSTEQPVLFVKNYGAVIVGASVEEVFYHTLCLINAIDVQLSVMPFGVDELHIPQEVGKLVELMHNPLAEHIHDEQRPCDAIFKSLVRLLDSAGYNTGYESTDKGGKKTVRSQSTTDIAPALALRADGRRSAFERTVTPLSFLNESYGTRSQASKWIVETSGLQRSRPATSMAQYPPNKFAPQGENPKELKQKFKEIRKEYFEDSISSGPQSSVLEGVTWDEVRKIKAGGGDGVLVTAASRGIIQRDHQKEALFYKNYTLGNPFENVTDHDLEKYMKDVSQAKK